MQTKPGERLGGVLLRAAGFPVLLGLLIFVGTLIENPDHSVRSMAAAFVFSCGFAALSSIPFVFFAWLRWQASKSRKALNDFDQTVKRRVRHSDAGLS